MRIWCVPVRVLHVSLKSKERTMTREEFEERFARTVRRSAALISTLGRTEEAECFSVEALAAKERYFTEHHDVKRFCDAYGNTMLKAIGIDTESGEREFAKLVKDIDGSLIQAVKSIQPAEDSAVVQQPSGDGKLGSMPVEEFVERYVAVVRKHTATMISIGLAEQASC